VHHVKFLKGKNMADINEIPPFPNPGVRLVKEDEHIAIWEEVFEPGTPTSPHRHIRDYIAIFPHAGELTLIPLAGEPEEYTFIAGEVHAVPAETGKLRMAFSAGTMVHSRVPADGAGHFAVNEGQQAAPMILIEIKGTATEKSKK
jgi:hypothetical protein